MVSDSDFWWDSFMGWRLVCLLAVVTYWPDEMEFWVLLLFSSLLPIGFLKICSSYESPTPGVTEEPRLYYLRCPTLGMLLLL